MKNKKKELACCLGIVVGMLLLVGLDQWTKALASAHLKGREALVLIPGVFELSYLENRGAAFGMFSDMRWIFMAGTIVILVVALFCIVRFPKERPYVPFLITMTVIASGGVGNMIDRISLGYVVDFFYFSLIDFPVFNVADIYVTVGAVFFVIFYLLAGEDTFSCLFGKRS